MLQVVMARNPSPLTGPGTNTFVLGKREVAVIDPGPDDAEHRGAILSAIGAGTVTAILLTHAHRDHSEGAAALSRATGAPVFGFAPPPAGRSPTMQRLAAEGLAGGGEGIDPAYAPDRLLHDGDLVSSDEWALQTIWTPGHFAGHLSFLWGRTLFCGDLILGWASTLISPPDGDLTDYLRSLQRVAALSPERLLPAHGAAVEHPAARIAELLSHRRSRTADILGALSEGPANATGLARRIYTVKSELLPAASRNVLAHLVALHDLGAVTSDGPLTADRPVTRA